MTDHNHSLKSLLRFLLGLILLGAAGKVLAPYGLAITLGLTALGVLAVIATVIFTSLGRSRRHSANFQLERVQALVCILYDHGLRRGRLLP